MIVRLLTARHVFRSVAEAVVAMDATSDVELARQRAARGSYPEAKVRTKGEVWCSKA